MTMKQGKFGKIIIWFLALLVGLSFNTIQADQVKFMSVGMLQNWFSSTGCEIEIGRTGATTDQQDGFMYPALYRWQDMQAQKGLWIGAKNYTDPLVGGGQYDYKVVHVGPREVSEGTQIMPQEFTLYGRFNHPSVYVDNLPASTLMFQDKDVEVDPDLKSHRMLHNVVNTAMGITFTRNVYSYAHSEHDEYFIYDFVLKNTGIYTDEGDVNQQTLEDVILFFQHRWAMTKYPCDYGYGWTPQSATWGHNTVNEVLHQQYGDEYNATYAWHGLHSKYEAGSQGDNIGAPNTGAGDKPADGFLGAPQFPGVVSIHADKSPDDNSNDPTQFANAAFFGSDASVTQPPHDQFNATKMGDEYSFMSNGIKEQTHAADLNYPHNPGRQDAPFTFTSNADEHSEAGGGGMSQGIGFGPYDLAPGDSVRIVIAEAVGSISWEKRAEVGKNWFNASGDYTLPDGSTTDDRDEYKDAWVFTGKDSLMQAFDKAIETYSKWESGQNIPLPPEPPASFTVTSGGDRINLEWVNNAEANENFGGYRIYRQVGTPDTTFEMIYECGEGTGNPVVNIYADKTAQRGFDYYYYITSFDNGNVHPEGKTLESSLFWTRTIEPAYLRRPPGDELENIRIVPNPFNVSATKYQFGTYAKERLMFYNLPGECNIKIYTERGDLIKTINHDDGSGDEAWNLTTSSRQVVASGVYIAYFESPDGEQVIKKFVIVR